jgi:hypothetical protein
VTHHEPQNLTMIYVVIAFALGVIAGKLLRDPPEG